MPVYESFRSVCLGREVRISVRMDANLILIVCKNRYAPRICKINSTNSAIFITNSRVPRFAVSATQLFRRSEDGFTSFCVMDRGPMKNLPAIAGRFSKRACGLRICYRGINNPIGCRRCGGNYLYNHSCNLHKHLQNMKL